MTCIPIDPLDLEQLPPADVDTCPRCDGSGALWPTNDPQDVVDCPVCKGDGFIPEWSRP